MDLKEILENGVKLSVCKGDETSGPYSIIGLQGNDDAINFTLSEEEKLLSDEVKEAPTGLNKTKGNRISGAQARQRKKEKAAMAASAGEANHKPLQLAKGQTTNTPKRDRKEMASPNAKTPQSKSPDAKKPKGPSFADVVQKTESWRSLRRQDGSDLQEDDVEKFRGAINKMLLDSLMSSTEAEVPIFDGINLMDGRILTKCANKCSHDWLMSSLPDLAAETGHILIAEEPQPRMLPIKRTRVFLTLHTIGITIETSKCFDVLAKQNAGLDTSAWRIWQRQDMDGAVKLTCGIDDKSVAFIKERQNILHFLGGTVRFFVEEAGKSRKKRPGGKNSSVAGKRTKSKDDEATAEQRVQSNLFQRRQPQVGRPVDKGAEDARTSQPISEDAEMGEK